jgi:UPF0288 family protein (methanogenesis marker protein 3)
MNSGSEGVGPVLLISVNEPMEAEIILSKLRSAGIESWCRHEAASVVYGLTVDGLGQQDIMVRVEDLLEAQAALEPED